ncbi:hypothetical protein AMTR_s03293p00008490 [Amborella trichopoda]|uniref:Uncharacterized protein n=1 Tax=Amborella trichopoda TaxID=13333 RepID=U5CKX2_AMBTC|nr:hypothetical protein AMTR_s03293p00008490 [Amborella trichopoda]
MGNGYPCGATCQHSLHGMHGGRVCNSLTWNVWRQGCNSLTWNVWRQGCNSLTTSSSKKPSKQIKQSLFFEKYGEGTVSVPILDVGK